ncbi:aminoglycoside 6'-N-acetyltransferase [Yersinia mollaretii]|uniref:aminoglycoside 6'-N-acetyltransferase n=1 Tax=Yersinia mollaretii TaxID=33060 RepID=UPI0005DA6CDB|nr:aminoglycoside 6'-N-acetyltransferase [Yersinia mollaretii]MDA5525958.1 aminoglycoside 6'-N-acetyltransferase [Yersinia mollaretii]MDR7872063.1 aminoglycoside 6'-N-acetyltransferase [Yersinia mollaretii]PHZ31062.1 aminoglycoside 6'-N-acetyltransferase [Yersinia mollaretii]WQC73407.1 aminoglycoside 6'-N-acetyltransferase [Yersinia mollaretii]CNE19069.1 Acetyltransferase (GNAT) family [Yersinia mollaretii]
MEIKKLSSANINLWIALREQLWPHHPENANRSDGKNIILSDELASFIAVDEDGLGIGFADASIRNDYVNGCIHSPVAFLEGIFIVPPSRRGGVAKQLVDAVQAWGLEKGCQELASDTALDNVLSQQVHEALGFKETERVVYYRKVSLR